MFACSLVSCAVVLYTSVLKCYHSNFSDPEMLGFVNKLTVIPSYNKHFGSFPENSLNGGVRYNEQFSPVPWYFVRSRFHCRFHCIITVIIRALRTVPNSPFWAQDWARKICGFSVLYFEGKFVYTHNASCASLYT